MNYRNWMRQEVAELNGVVKGDSRGYTTGGSSNGWDMSSDTNSSGVKIDEDAFFFSSDDDDLGDCQFFIPNK